MCVLLCANSIVREWFDQPAALEYRQSLQLSTAHHATNSITDSDTRARESLRNKNLLTPHIMKRSAWLQAYCKYRANLVVRGRHRAACGGSSSDWPKAFEAIAETWRRLLCFVGLRW
jgi:hypothetical protein